MQTIHNAIYLLNADGTGTEYGNNYALDLNAVPYAIHAQTADSATTATTATTAGSVSVTTTPSS